MKNLDPSTCPRHDNDEGKEPEEFSERTRRRIVGFVIKLADEYLCQDGMGRTKRTEHVAFYFRRSDAKKRIVGELRLVPVVVKGCKCRFRDASITERVPPCPACRTWAKKNGRTL